MVNRGTYFLFTIERYDREFKAVRVIAAVIIAAEDPLYVARLRANTTDVEDLSQLVVGAVHAQQVLDELERLVDKPRTEITRDFIQLHPLFQEAAPRDATVVFSRMAGRTSFVRRIDRYEHAVQDFVIELIARQR